MRRLLKRFVRHEKGVTAIEVGLGAAILSVAAVAVMETVGEGSTLTYARAVYDYAQAGVGWVLARF